MSETTGPRTMLLHDLSFSEPPRILLTGADGQLGWELRRIASTLGEMFATVASSGRRHIASGELLNLADEGSIERVMREVEPHIILNAAAFTDVEQAEREHDAARAINGVAPGLLAREAARRGALLVHYSTDNVFDGELDRPYTPDDLPEPANFYGRTKLEGEDAIRTSGAPHLILRTSWLYAARGNNFLNTVLDLVDSGRTLSVVSDQFGAPTRARMVAVATGQILAQARVAGADWTRERLGTYHFTASGRCSWYEFAQAIVERYTDAAADEATPGARITPQSTSQFPARAKRPVNGLLDSTAMQRAFGIVPEHWAASLDQVMEEVREHRRRRSERERARREAEPPPPEDAEA